MGCAADRPTRPRGNGANSPRNVSGHVSAEIMRTKQTDKKTPPSGGECRRAAASDRDQSRRGVRLRTTHHRRPQDQEERAHRRAHAHPAPQPRHPHRRGPPHPAPLHRRLRRGDRSRRSERARKLLRKGADLIVANDVKDPSIGFDSDQNEVLVIAASDGSATRIAKSAKSEIANRLLDVIVARLQ